MLMQSGLPVCAIAFPTLPELVRHGENGFIFQTPLELKDRLFDLLIAEGHERVLEGLCKVTPTLLYLFLLCVCVPLQMSNNIMPIAGIS